MFLYTPLYNKSVAAKSQKNTFKNMHVVCKLTLKSHLGGDNIRKSHLGGDNIQEEPRSPGPRLFTSPPALLQSLHMRLYLVLSAYVQCSKVYCAKLHRCIGHA